MFNHVVDGSSRGFAIAKFDLEKDAENAIKALNGATHSGRVLEARFDRGVEAVSGDRKCVYVGNLPLDCTAEELKAFFGTVERVQSVQLQSKSGVSAWAIVAYDSMADAIAATKRYSGKEFRSAGPLLSVRLDRKIGKPVAK